MKYYLIRNGKIVGYNNEEQADILICDSTIVYIGHNILHPSIETHEYDAQNRYVMPAGIEINSRFNTFEDDGMIRSANDYIKAGTTVWLTDEQTAAIQPVKKKTAVSPLNFSYHFRLDSLRSSDHNKQLNLALTQGITTALYRIHPSKGNEFDKIEQMMEEANRLNILIMFEICDDGTADDILKTMSEMTEKLRSTKRSRILFSNVRYEKIFDMICSLREAHEIHVQLCYSTTASRSLADLDTFSPERFADLVRNNEWCIAAVARKKRSASRRKEWNESDIFIKQNKLPILAAIDCNPRLSLEEIVEMAVARPCKLFGLTPARGRVAVGAAADLIIWDDQENEKYFFQPANHNEPGIDTQGSIEAVFMNGELVYESSATAKETHLSGNAVYRRN